MRSLLQPRRFGRLRIAIFLTVICTSIVFVYQHLSHSHKSTPKDEDLFPAMEFVESDEEPSISGSPSYISIGDAQFLPKWGNSAVFTNESSSKAKGKWNYHKPRTSFIDLVNFVNPSGKVNLETMYPVSKLREVIRRLNKEERIQNLKLFPNRPDNGVIIVVQVHKRLEYMIELLDSLSKARGIQDALLIISHDYFSNEINQVVKAVNFCQVLQIFFPYSEQLFPDSYPGTDPNDCARDLSKEDIKYLMLQPHDTKHSMEPFSFLADEHTSQVKNLDHTIDFYDCAWTCNNARGFGRAKKRGCNNAAHPDKYGHYREAKFVMTKHHWWWKANMVFDKLKVTKFHPGPVTFLEEDHYVAPDFVQLIVLLHGLRKRARECNEGTCDILSLGMYVKPENYQSGSNQVTLTRWRSYDHNMGMTLYRSTWEKLKKCSKEFCKYDDYNWDWTLMYLSMFCLEKPLTALSLDMPRVFHIGECGMHHKDNCDSKTAVNNYKALIDRNKDHFFPREIRIANVEEGSAHVGIENGGWGDLRDHELCRSFNKKKKK